MKAQTVLLPSQPLTHTSQFKSWRQWCICCQDYSLTSQQLHCFYALKQQANVLFEPPNQRWDLIKALYIEYFETDSKTQGKQFLRLGFQGQYPQTDLRGGGILSLQLIIRFVRNKKELVKVMQKDKGNFFFAITAINLAFFLKKYFHLADFLQVNRDQSQYCNRRALKNFCRILSKSQTFFHDIHEILLEYFYKKIWLKAQQDNINTLLQFNSLFEKLTNKIRKCFEGYNLGQPRDFLERWDYVNSD